LKPFDRVMLWAPVVAYMALIFWISSIAHPITLPEGPGDKGAHALLYAGLGVLVVRALAGGWRRPLTLMGALAAVLICTAYGITDEFHQRFVPPREADVLDVAADAAGAIAAVMLMRLVARRARGPVRL
jgi:VanZ family protein